VLVVIGVLVCVVGLAGCVGRPEDTTEDGRIIVNYWEKWTGFEGEAMQAVVDDFNNSQDRILVKMLTISQIDQKLMLATAGGNPPDVAGLWSHWVNVYAEKGALVPLGGMIERAGINRGNYIPVFWDLCKHRGFMWALPTTPGTVALHWNKKLFREAGLDPESPPTSLEELDRMAEQLTIVEVVRDGKPVRVRFSELTSAERENEDFFKLIQLGHSPSEPGWWKPMWGYWFGGELSDGDRMVTPNTPENIEAFTWYESYAKKYGVNNLREFTASFFTLFSSPQNPFLTGEVAMEIQGVWMHNFIEKYAPHIEWGAAPFPARDPQKYPVVTIAECDVLVMPKGSKHPEEAFEFIKYVNSRKPMEKLCMGQRKFSPLSSVSSGFMADHPNPNIEVFIEAAKSPHACIVPRLTVWNEYSDEMIAAVDKVFALDATPEEALSYVKKRVQWKFDRV